LSGVAWHGSPAAWALAGASQKKTNALNKSARSGAVTRMRCLLQMGADGLFTVSPRLV
jgi:hypothetical protein